MTGRVTSGRPAGWHATGGQWVVAVGGGGRREARCAHPSNEEKKVMGVALHWSNASLAHAPLRARSRSRSRQLARGSSPCGRPIAKGLGFIPIGMRVDVSDLGFKGFFYGQRGAG